MGKHLGNILTTNSTIKESLYNVVSNKEELIEGIPTLIIGWELAKINYKEANILNWKINKDIYWTFGHREKRDRFDECFRDFKKITINNLVKKLKYKYFSISTSTEDEKILFSNILKNEALSVYINENMIYFYNDLKKEVLGVSILDILYGGYDVKKLFSKIYNSENLLLVENNKVPIDIKIAFKNYNYVIPSLFI